MQFREGTQVLTSRGEAVGEVERVVLNPQTKEVSHVVVRKGLLFTTDKVVPLSLIGSATRGRVVLRRGAGDLEKLPDFEETNYIPVDDQEARAYYAKGTVRPLYWYPAVGGGGFGAGYGFGWPPQPLYVIETELNIPEGTVALKEGAKVISSDDEHVGDVKGVLTGAQDDRVTHFVIERGLLLKEEKLAPVDWVSWIGEDEIHLSVGAQFLEALPAYEQPETGA